MGVSLFEKISGGLVCSNTLLQRRSLSQPIVESANLILFLFVNHDSPQCLSRRNCRGWRLFEQGYRRSETTPDGGDLEAQRTTHSTGIHELSGGTTRRSASCRPLRRRIHVS